jgi:hypothetical protein
MEINHCTLLPNELPNTLTTAPVFDVSVYFNFRYNAVSNQIDDLPKPHEQIRSRVTETVVRKVAELNRKASLSANLQEFIRLNLTIPGSNLRASGSLYSPEDIMHVSFHYLRGYDAAILGEDPFLDEIRESGWGIRPGMFSPALQEFLKGFYGAIHDHFVLQIEKDFNGQSLMHSKNKKPPAIRSLKEAFTNIAAYNECIDALRNVKDPIISVDKKYLLGPRQKSAFTAWYDILRTHEKLNTGIIASAMAILINKEIEGIDLCPDGSMFSKPNTSAYTRYKPLLTKLIN